MMFEKSTLREGEYSKIAMNSIDQVELNFIPKFGVILIHDNCANCAAMKITILPQKAQFISRIVRNKP